MKRVFTDPVGEIIKISDPPALALSEYLMALYRFGNSIKTMLVRLGQGPAYAYGYTPSYYYAMVDHLVQRDSEMNKNPTIHAFYKGNPSLPHQLFYMMTKNHTVNSNLFYGDEIIQMKVELETLVRMVFERIFTLKSGDGRLLITEAERNEIEKTGYEAIELFNLYMRTIYNTVRSVAVAGVQNPFVNNVPHGPSYLGQKINVSISPFIGKIIADCC